jgi:hypothetical protein
LLSIIEHEKSAYKRIIVLVKPSIGLTILGFENSYMHKHMINYNKRNELC